MLNINAPLESFAYKIAKENKQLGWFFSKDKPVNLFDLIFKTKRELTLYPDFYFDWNLDLFFFKNCFSVQLNPYRITNIPFILENAPLINKTLKELNIELKEIGGEFYLDLSKITFNFKFPNLVYTDTFYLEFDFWRYFYFYAPKTIKKNIESVTKGDNEIKIIKQICKKSPIFFSNLSKKNLLDIRKFLNFSIEHDLTFLDCTDLEVVSKVIKLEKKYSVPIFALFSLLKKIPNDEEIRAWEINLRLDLEKDLRIPILENKILSLEYGWKVYELTTKAEMIEEATYQHNCLRGYIGLLSNPDYHFFSCRKNKERFTTLFINGKLSECKGRFNKEVSRFTQEIKEELEYILLNLEGKINGRK